ncbi:MAG: ThuA domain-containing protein [Fibrobacteres bacterium]|nr:ThuA domain-containing protein [Fibrobacterota bacterium]
MKNVLMVWGGWDGHTPKASIDVFEPLLREKDFNVTVRNDLKCYADKDLMAAQDLIVQCFTMSKIEKEESEGLLSAVRSGTGFAGWHGGIIDSFRENTAYQWMTGAQWVAHPGNCIPSHRVQITDKDHEIVKGLKDFDLPDSEQYFIHIDPSIHVLCQTTFSGEYGDSDLYTAGTVMPYAYTKTYGKGRIFVANWGHTFKDFEIYEAREIILRGLLWAALVAI